MVSTKPCTGAKSDCDQRLDRVGADAGPGEHLLHQHVGAEQEREHHAERGDDRQHRVAERVGEDHGAADSPLARAVRTKSDASTASIEARVMRVIGASEKIASVTAGRINWRERGAEGLEVARDQAVDQVEAGDIGGAVENASSRPSGAGDQPSLK